MTVSLVSRFYRRRSKWRRDMRMLFPSPAEIRFIKMLGGHCTTFGRVRHPATHFPLVLVWSLGPVLKSEMIQREVRVGKFWVDFGVATDYYKKGIEIDGDQYHRDILKESDRAIYFSSRGWQVLHVRPLRMITQPDRVKNEVLEFFAK